MAVLARDFFNDMVPHLRGLEAGTVRKLTLVLAPDRAAEMTIEMYAEKLSPTVLTKVYELIERPSDKEPYELPAGEGGVVDVPRLESHSMEYALPLKGDA